MEENKGKYLTLEVKHFILQRKARKPRKSISDLIFDISTKSEGKTSAGTIQRVLKAKY